MLLWDPSTGYPMISTVTTSYRQLWLSYHCTTVAALMKYTDACFTIYFIYMKLQYIGFVNISRLEHFFYDNECMCSSSLMLLNCAYLEATWCDVNQDTSIHPYDSGVKPSTRLHFMIEKMLKCCDISFKSSIYIWPLIEHLCLAPSILAWPLLFISFFQGYRHPHAMGGRHSAGYLVGRRGRSITACRDLQARYLRDFSPVFIALVSKQNI